MRLAFRRGLGAQAPGAQRVRGEVANVGVFTLCERTHWQRVALETALVRALQAESGLPVDNAAVARLRCIAVAQCDLYRNRGINANSIVTVEKVCRSG